jgi:putrescine transport system permease protein
MGRAAATALGALAFGYAFLYVPILCLVVYSFNESRLVTVWAGFSFKWYGELFRNEAILDATWLSLRIAAAVATVSTLLGLSAALALERARHFAGRALLLASLLAPLVIPEVMMGLASLLTFVSLEAAIGWPRGRGALTISIAHITFGLAYAAIVIRARLADLDPDLEAAAADLGAGPWAIFRQVTLPQLYPALAAAWLLAFTLSLDDLVIASFASGPGSSTLPLVVFSSVRLGLSPQVNALATLLIAVVAFFVAIASIALARDHSKSNRSEM